MIRYIAMVSLSFIICGCEISEFQILEADSQDVGYEASDDEDYSEGSITLYWSAPIERVNGELMTLEEVGGYEIRYRKNNEMFYSNILIEDSSVEQYTLAGISNAKDYVIEVAVFDSLGVYSDFVVAVSGK